MKLISVLILSCVSFSCSKLDWGNSTDQNTQTFSGAVNFEILNRSYALTSYFDYLSLPDQFTAGLQQHYIYCQDSLGSIILNMTWNGNTDIPPVPFSVHVNLSIILGANSQEYYFSSYPEYKPNSVTVTFTRFDTYGISGSISGTVNDATTEINYQINGLVKATFK